MEIAIIGSGLGGLAAAIRLQAQGHQVTILEKRDKPGGRAYLYEQNGFRFDGGPTIITAPNFIHDLFALTGRKTEDYAHLVKLDPFYNIRFEDGSVFHYNDDEKALVEQIRAFNPADVTGYERFYRASQAVFEKGLPLMTQPFLSPLDMLKIDPLHFRDTLNSYKGSAFSLEPTLFQSAWFRPHNRSEDIPNLYFVGAGTHPGAGIPGVLSSGKIVAALIAAAR